MSTTIAALLATLIVTGLTSAASHNLTLIGGCAASLIFMGCTLLSRGAVIYPLYLVAAAAMTIIVLLSSEANAAEFSSTIFVLTNYMPLLALSFSSRDVSGFCQRLMLFTNVTLTGWILYQGYTFDKLQAWQISNPSGAGNLMPAQINMTLALVLSRINDASGLRRLCYLALLGLNGLAVVLVMSRNGIGAMLILITLYMLFNRKQLAFLAVTGIAGAIIFFDQLISLPAVQNMLVKMRVVGYVPSAPRTVIWKISLSQALDHPWLGVGPGEPKKILAVLDINHAHNNIIQVAFETGILSGVLMAAITVMLLWLPVQMIFRRRDCFVHTLPILAYVIFSWTGGPLQFPGATLLLAASVNEARSAVKRQKDELKESKGARESQEPSGVSPLRKPQLRAAA